MHRPGFAMPMASGIALVLSLLTSAALCQTPPDTTATAPVTTAPADPNAAFLAKASSLYYSTTKQGLTGFDCTVHPDWVNIFKIVEKQSTPTASVHAEYDKDVELLNSLKITLHARLTGPGSGMDWEPETWLRRTRNRSKWLTTCTRRRGRICRDFYSSGPRS